MNKDYLRVLVFFDLFSHPLSLSELHRFLPVKIGVERLTEDLASATWVEREGGFYFLKGRREILAEAKKRELAVVRKMKRARLAASLFRLLPWVEMIAVTNFKGENNLRDGSDIDLFIVSSAGRIWLTRFFCAGMMKLLGWRPRGQKVRDRICLSFYVDRDNLNLERFKLPGDDIDYIYWLANFVPIYDKNGTAAEFWRSNNWLSAYLPNWSPPVSSDSQPSDFWRRFSGKNKFFDWLEILSKTYQLRIMPAVLKDKINQGSEVVIEDGVLKLHAKDKRRQTASEFADKFKKIYGKNN